MSILVEYFQNFNCSLEEERKKMDSDILRIAINKKFGSLSKGAAAAGMTISNFSKSLKNPSTKFLATLEKLGVNVEKYQKSKLTFERIAVENEYVRLLKEQEKIMNEKDELIKELKNLVNQKDRVIEQYEALIGKKKGGSQK